MKILSLCTILLHTSATQAFLLNKPTGRCSVATLKLSENDHNSKDFPAKREFSKAIATAVAATILTGTLPFSNVAVAFTGPPPASAQATTLQLSAEKIQRDSQYNNNNNNNNNRVSLASFSGSSPISSSSLEISESIKVLDLDMPTYDKISTAKTSQDDIEGKDMKGNDMKSTKEKEKKTSTPKKKDTNKDGNGGGDGGSFFSFSSSSSSGGSSKSGPTAEEKKAKAEELRAQKEAQRLEKEKAMEEKKSEAMEIVNMDMPSYGTTDGSKKSVFSL